MAGALAREGVTEGAGSARRARSLALVLLGAALGPVAGGFADAGASKPQEPKPPYPYDTVAVSIPNSKAPGVVLAGTLTVPRSPGPHPAALLVSGSGPQDRDESILGHRPFWVLADHLTRRGLAVLRVDDRGTGASTGNFTAATGEDFGSDALSLVDFLAKRKEVDPRRIAVIGHSEGALVAAWVANRSRHVGAIVLLAGPGVPGDSVLLLQNAALRRSMGGSDSLIAAELVLQRRLHQAIKRKDDAAANAVLRDLVRLQLAAVPEEQRLFLPPPDTIVVRSAGMILGPWMRHFVAYDPRPELRRVKVPVLALVGERDIQVLPKENLGAIREALAAGKNRAATVKELPGLNHLFQRCRACTMAELGQLDETIAPEALEEISGWLSTHPAKSR